MRRLAWCAVPLLAALAATAGTTLSWELISAVAFGWLAFLRRVLPRVSGTQAGALTLLICVVPLALGLHLFLTWLSANLGAVEGAARPPRRPWRVRWTAAGLLVVVLMFVAGIAAAGLAHQTGWLIKERAHWAEYRDLGGRARANLKEMGSTLPLLGDSDQPGMLPAGATYDAAGRPLHGWQTRLLPFLGLRSDNVDMTIPWDDPRNAPCFKAYVPQYLNPAIAVVRDREGYGLSHYAGNVHVLGRRPRAPASLSNGAANTLLIGEVASNFKPWGDPLSGRDPTAGLNTTPDGFTSLAGGAVNFAFVDGSVRAVRPEVDPKVLRALAGQPPERP